MTILEATLQEVDSGKVWDISELIESPLKWSTQLESSFPGKMEFKLSEDSQVKVSNGDELTVKIDSHNIFKGKIRTRGIASSGGSSITAYDNKFLLKSKDTIVFSAAEASSRFAQICTAANIPHKVINNSEYNCAEFVADAKSYHEMIQNAIDETRAATTGRYMITDNFGVLEFNNLAHLKSPYVLGDEALVTDYDYSISSEEALNSIKVIKEDSETKERQVALAKDDKSIARWGLLQDVVSPDNSDMNMAQMQVQANNLLKEGNRETKTLQMNCLGILSFKAGSAFRLQVKRLEVEGIKNAVALVTKCDHNFGKTHTMSLEVEVQD